MNIKLKNGVIIGAVIAAILTAVFLWGGNTPSQHDRKSQLVDSELPTASVIPSDTALPSASVFSPQPTQASKKESENKPQPSVSASEKPGNHHATTENEASEPDVSYSEENGMEINDETGQDQYQTNPVPEGKPVPIEPQNVTITDKEYTCTLSIRCDTALKNSAHLKSGKKEILPENGVLLEEQTVSLYEGESVFNLLLRETKKHKIHMEFTKTPIYNSAYIEGIGNLYELDCGELSGWMYKVNGWFPNYGCSRYQLHPGDRVEWVYTCDLGMDVGGYSATGSQRDE